MGRGFLVLALCGTAVGCGDDDDDAPPPDAGARGGAGGSRGGSGGSGGRAGAGSGGTVSAAQCETTATAAAKNTGVSAGCIDCACKASPTVVAGCNAACWSLINCSATLCASELADPARAQACAISMCGQFISQAGAVPAAPMTGAVLQGTTCRTACARPVAPPPTPDGGVDDGGVDGGS